MAQADTGLGWSAKEEWLRYSDTYSIGTLSTSALSGESVYSGNIRIPGSRDVMTDSIIAGGYNLLTVNGDPLYIALAPAMPLKNPYAFIYLDNWNTVVICFVSDVDLSPAARSADVRGYWAWGSGAGQRTWALWQWPASSSYDSATGLYYVTWATNQAFSGFVAADAYNAASLRDGLDHYGGVQTNFTKDGNGYAVTCMARWKTSNGTVLASPILISNDTNYVDAISDGGQDLNKLNILYYGVKFYMAFYQDFVNGNIYQANCPTLDLTGSDDPNLSLDSLFKIIASSDYANIQVLISPDPYQEGDGSQEGGLDGEEDDGEDVDFTDPPSTSIGATGFLTIFCPSLYELQQLGQFMWSTFDVDNWRKIIANPMDAILGLHIIPVPAVITGTKSLKVAGIDTTYTMSYTTVRYIRRSMGSCDIPKKWGAYLDYNPYTKLSIFLPYIGFKEIDADDVMGKTISLQYIIDILTGACVAELKCGDTVLYSWSGNCANEVPISSSDWRGAISAAVGIAATIAATAAVTGGATAPMAASMIASVGANSMNLKPTISRSGSISGSAGFIGQQRPYIIRTIPNLVIPADQNKFIGYPSFVTISLGSLTGYNEISSIHLEGIPATGAELDELESILKGGVIF